ncbi:MAG: GHKL domain-containing protein [Candidatus Latescibacterota bacterium]|nr:MAG: GHKL domain-containing protein [Candidatus Latescibacterota bacterium]
MAIDEIRNWIQTELFDAVPVNICVIDRKFRIVEANDPFRKTYGAWKNRCCYTVYKGRSERCKQCGAEKTFADGKVRVREEQGLVQNGRQVEYLVHLVPIVGPGRKIRHVIEMSTDITDVKKLEKDKREAERLAAVGETVAGIAHGIKNVLMGLEGGMYVFNTGLETDDEERITQGWEMLQGNITRISKFVKEFLDFARGRLPEVSLVDPNRPAKKVVELFRASAEIEGVVLADNLDEGIQNALLDEDGIHTCLANLVSNAIHACTMSDKKRKYIVTLSSKEVNGTLVYEVADNGCGMDYEISRKIFSSFFSTKGADTGTGLGLLTTKKIVHQHGGKVSFVTEEGVGSVFRIELPRDNLPEPKRENAEEEKQV